MKPPRFFIRKFLAVEMSVFLAQMAVICIVIWLLSNQMTTEEGVSKVLIAKIEGNSIKELGYTLSALVFVFGVVAIAQYFNEKGAINDISSAVMDEFPRTIYFFGANLTSASFMGGMYIHMNPSEAFPTPWELFAYAAFFALVFFSAGCLLRYSLNKKKARFFQPIAEGVSSKVPDVPALERSRPYS